MSLIDLVFYIFGALTVFSALMVVTQNHPVRSVLFLVLTFFGSVPLWLLCQAEFLSLILLLVYVGAVMTLFLFVVMMLHVDVEALKSHLLRLLPLGLLIVALLTALFVQAVSKSGVFQNGMTEQLTQATPIPNTEQIGLVLYTDYLYPFELSAVILLIAMVAAITLAHRGLVRSKRQNIREQIMTEASTRVRLVSDSSVSKKRKQS